MKERIYKMYFIALYLYQVVVSQYLKVVLKHVNLFCTALNNVTQELLLVM